MRLIVLLILGFVQTAAGQGLNVQVVSKKVEKTFSYQPGLEVHIEGEKAEITVETWKKNEIKVTLELISKHPQKKTAESDLEFINYIMEKNGARVLLRNFINAGSKPKSELKAKYLVVVPENCPVEMTNYFGKTHLSDLNGGLTVNSQFSPVTMQNLRGNVNVNSKFGDIFGERINGRVKIESQRSDVTLKEIAGAFNISSKYGVVKIFADKSLVDLDIDAQKSDVYLFNSEPSKFGYELVAHFGKITSPEDLKLNFIENTDKFRHAVFQPGNTQASVSVRITYGDIVIKNSKP
ncbi:MAG TPA: DUF4097 family beta strand repeat-containing protein [Saprospiraceae bacterium]|nr:DUF4097 family beta strand repeat-containing protein [Saprospiraceae bacterium]